MKIILLLLSFLAIAHLSQAQFPENLDSINRYDAYKRKVGFWLMKDIKGLDDPFPYTEYGEYSNGRKSGVWTKIDSYGRLKAMESFYKGILNGKVQYFEKGKLNLEGHYRGLNPDIKIDTVPVYDDDLELEVLVTVPTERGALKHGEWKYYDPTTGELLKIETYQVDSLIREKNFIDGIATSDSTYRRRIENEMPHKTDPTGHKHQKGKRRNSLIKY